MIKVGNGWVAGDAAEDATDTRGWLLGPHVDDDPMLASHAVQVKYACHPNGEGRSAIAGPDPLTSVCVLISGRMMLAFGDAAAGGDVVWLEKPGQFVVWRGVAHRWLADGPEGEETMTLTIRWAEPPAVDEGGKGE